MQRLARTWTWICALAALGCAASGEDAALHRADLAIAIATATDAGAPSVALSPRVTTGDLAIAPRGDGFACVDPEDDRPPLGWTASMVAADGVALAVARAERGEPLITAPRPSRRSTVRVVESLQLDDDEAPRTELRVGDTRIVIARASTSTTRPTTTTTLSTRTLDPGDAPLDDLDVVRSVVLETTGARVERVALARRSTGIVMDELGLAANLDPCEAEAFQSLGHVYPSDMPAVRFPPMTLCSHGECVAIKRSWIQAHHHVWWVHRAIEHLAALPASQRAQAWSLRGGGPGGVPVPVRDSTFSNWFGEYDGNRFQAVRQAINHLWTTYRTGKHGLVTLRHRCPHYPQQAGNACFTASFSPSAQHIVLGQVNYCPEFFGNSRASQTATSIHEPLHHVFVQLGGILRSIRDRHSHAHGVWCVSDRQGGAQYDLAEAEHLAQYSASDGGDCNHRSKAVRNVSNYHHFIRRFGQAIWDGTMVSWPVWPAAPEPPQPTPQPPAPGSCVLGTEGCLCAQAVYDDVPDGDHGIGLTCPDHDGEMSCASTRFGVQRAGICTRCEGDARRGGCECTSTEQCAPGLFCFGADTSGGGVGHCYAAEPPGWACLADCQRLYNDSGARCLQDYPTGGRCIDSLCSPMEAEQCFQQGRVCRYGDCVVECQSTADCHALGYPPETFECISHECRRAGWL